MKLFFRSLERVCCLSTIVLPAFNGSGKEVRGACVCRRDSRVFGLFGQLSSQLPYTGNKQTLLFRGS